MLSGALTSMSETLPGWAIIRASSFVGAPTRAGLAHRPSRLQILMQAEKETGAPFRTEAPFTIWVCERGPYSRNVWRCRMPAAGRYAYIFLRRRRRWDGSSQIRRARRSGLVRLVVDLLGGGKAWLVSIYDEGMRDTIEKRNGDFWVTFRGAGPGAKRLFAG